jgi:cytochrome b involved in lipid metabolism
MTNNKYILVPFAMLALMGAGCGSSSAPAPVQPITPASMPVEQTKGPYLLADVANHSTAQDCWMAISGKVYDVTAYIPMHPAGDKMLVGCGKDATSYFNQRPDGTSHSDRARALLDQYYIGDLKQ